jgi:hypothetical protein
MDNSNSLLTSLPQELIELIAQYLQLLDLCGLRLTCKALAANTSYYFGHTYHTTASTNISPQSIRKLGARTKSPWGKYITTLHLKWDQSAGQEYILLHDLTSISPVVEPIQHIAAMLTRLPNYHSIRITVPYMARIVRPASLDALSPGDLIGIAFMLIAETSVSLRSFSVFLGSTHNDCRLNSVQIQTWRLYPAVNTAWSHLQNLELRFYGSVQMTCEWAWGLVGRAPHLRRLDWQVRCSDPVYYSPTHLATSMQELKLRYASLSGSNLLALLARCPQLRKLALHGIKIDPASTWKDVFVALQGCEHLESLFLYYLRVGYNMSKRRRFLGLKDGMVEGMKMICKVKEEGSINVGVEYSGSEMKKVLSMLAEAIED